jgi:hypothetical protein
MYTRSDDILNLLESRQKARNSFERDLYERGIAKIKSESKQVEGIRKKLVMAIRNDDKRAVSRFRQDLMMIQADQTYGKNY